MATPGLAQMLSKARRLLLRRGASEEDADELVQEAFLRIERYERSHPARSKEALLVTAAVNLAVDRARRRARAPFVEANDIHAIADCSPDAAHVLEQRARLRRAAEGIAQLPERTRNILLKRRLENLSYKEIAEAEGLSVSAVEKQVARATLRLMEWMEGW
ncbi:RNA polymerase sigma factor [Sphingosinicella terrae]|jgi:RNA polymerase sigma factor (sigma-70 family)|uniref:RNA polymerase sigma factor n=1 Tax=Sphingosinicella terrae TaxID=2172047 RepID=UPI000E0D9F30|nr:RNA polymerase sigma factor [Sphingosinicella terrae]